MPWEKAVGLGMDLGYKQRTSVPGNISSGFREGRKNGYGETEVKNKKRVEVLLAD